MRKEKYDVDDIDAWQKKTEEDYSMFNEPDTRTFKEKIIDTIWFLIAMMILLGIMFVFISLGMR